MSRWLPRLARLGYWLACSSGLCLIWMAIAYPAWYPKHLPAKWIQVVWWTLCLYAPVSVLLGAVAWAGIRLRGKQFHGMTYAHAAMVVGLSACAVVVYGTSQFMEIRSHFFGNLGGGYGCYMRIRYLGESVRMYSQDYDERYPLASSWNESTEPYTGVVANKERYRCPQEYNQSAPSYGMNRLLAGAREDQIAAPGKTVMLIDASPGSNRVVVKADWPFTDRHGNFINLAYADGHFKQKPIDETLKLTWAPEPIKRKPAPAKGKR